MGILSILGFENNKIKDALRRGAVIIDIRTAADFDRGKVPDSVNIPVDRLTINIKRIRNIRVPIVICGPSDSINDTTIRMLKENGVREIYNGGSWTKVLRLVKAL